MTRSVAFILSLVLAAAALTSTAASSAQGGTVTCASNEITGTVDANVDVPAGFFCIVYGGEITGNVTVEGTLVVYGGTFGGNVTVDGGTASFWLTFGCRACPERTRELNQVAGSITFTNAQEVYGCCANEVGFTVVGKNIIIDGNSVPVDLQTTWVGGNVTISNNTAPISVYRLTVGRNLNCDGNTTAPTLIEILGSPGLHGQCGVS